MRHVLRSLARRWLERQEEIKPHSRHLKVQTKAAAPRLVEAVGVELDIAAEMLVTAGDNSDRVSSDIVWRMESPKRPDDLRPEIAEISYTPDPHASSTPGPGSCGITDVKQSNEAMLFAIVGVEGVAIGRDQIGRDAIVVFVRDASVKSRLPGEIDGFPVVVEVTGVIEPL